MKIRPVGVELFYAGGQLDRQKDMTKMIVAFRNFANAPKTRLLVFTTDIASSNFVCSSTKLFLSLRRADGYVLSA